MTIPSRNFAISRPRSSSAPGASRNLPNAVRERTAWRRPLLVTDPGLAGMAMVKEVVDDLELRRPRRSSFSRRAAQSGGSQYPGRRQGLSGTARHDGVIAFGGGSALDVGKLIALMHGQTISVFDLEDIGDWWTRANAQRSRPIIAVPTTAGTGSEVGRAGVVTHPETHEKKIIFHPAHHAEGRDPRSRADGRPAAEAHGRNGHGRAGALPRGLLRALLSSARAGRGARGHAADQGESAEGGEEGQAISMRAATC